MFPNISTKLLNMNSKKVIKETCMLSPYQVKIMITVLFIITFRALTMMMLVDSLNDLFISSSR